MRGEDQELLVLIAKGDPNAVVRTVALKKLDATHAEEIKEIYLNDENRNVREQAEQRMKKLGIE